MAKAQLAAQTGKNIGAIALFLVVILGSWWALYPGPDDPKGFEYIGWRSGLPTLNQDHALGTMVGDRHKDVLVLGKTRNELIERFGYITTLEEASDYSKFCYSTSSHKGEQVLFLRRSNWMVVMKNDRATDLVLMKGC